MPPGKSVPNRLAVEINREFGDVVFQADAPGEYFVYYMPFAEKMVDWSTRCNTRRRRPPPTRPGSSATAWRRTRLGDGKWRTLPEAQVVEFQTWDDFHRFDPMEVIATAAETQAVGGRPPRPLLLCCFPRIASFPSA